MPFKSEAQHRFFRAAAARGEIPKEKVEEWMRETKAVKGDKHPIKKLPEYVHGKTSSPELKKKLKKQAMFKGFFVELEKIAQTPGEVPEEIKKFREEREVLDRRKRLIQMALRGDIPLRNAPLPNGMKAKINSWFGEW